MKKNITAAFEYFQNDIIGVENRTIAIFWALAVAGILAMGGLLGSSATTFQGVAGSRESNINFEYPVEIKRVHVIAGQKVKKGDLLLELSQSGLNMQIRQQQAQLVKLKSEKSVRDQINKAVGNRGSDLSNDPLVTEIKELEDELAILDRQRKNLFVFSEIDGIVGSVNFRRGERAPSFASLVTLSVESPTFIQGFVHEKVHADLKIGAKVTVTSMANADSAVKGRVVSVGSRLVEMPARMANPTIAQQWGREVVVQIPANSTLLLGEKVQISPVVSFLPSFIARADDGAEVVEAQGAKSIHVPSTISEKMNFEPSGLIYLSDLKKFLVVSDDTDNEHKPALFLMSPEGEVSEQVLSIPGIPEIMDMESISAEGDWIYVMTSLSAKKKGEPKAERNLFVRMKRNGLSFYDVQKMNLGIVLRKALARSTSPVFQELAREGFEKIEVEGHGFSNGDLIVSLKRPALTDGGMVFLKVSNLEEAFKGDELKIEEWKVLNLRTKDEQHQVSDLVIRKDEIFVLSTCRHDNCGGLWRATTNGPAKLLQHFNGLNPEGLAFFSNGSEEELMIAFDQGEDPAKFSIINLKTLSRE